MPAQSPRESMVRALAVGLVTALAAGDPDGARVANAAISALLGPLSNAAPGGVALLTPAGGR